MDNLTAAQTSVAAITDAERIATLEERSQHAATKSELHRSLFLLFTALLAALGGLMVHLHNGTLNEIAEIRTVLFEVMQALPGG